jgi:hypothetical protein
MSDSTEPPPLTEREMAELRSMYGVYQVNRAIERLRWLERDLAQRTAERDAAIDNRKISEGALIRTINSVVSQRDALAAEVAALKADPLAEMWRELAEYQPMADRDGHGESWRIMCELRTEEAASSARYVATMARTARDAVAFAEWVMSDKNAARASRAIAAIRRAKEAKP